MGFKPGTKAFMLYDLDNKVTYVSRNVTFEELIFPYKGSLDLSSNVHWEGIETDHPSGNNNQIPIHVISPAAQAESHGSTKFDHEPSLVRSLEPDLAQAHEPHEVNSPAQAPHVHDNINSPTFSLNNDGPRRSTRTSSPPPY